MTDYWHQQACYDIGTWHRWRAGSDLCHLAYFQ